MTTPNINNITSSNNGAAPPILSTTGTTKNGRTVKLINTDYLNIRTTQNGFLNKEVQRRAHSNNEPKFSIENSVKEDLAKNKQLAELTEKFFAGTDGTKNLTLEQTKAASDQFLENHSDLTTKQQADVMLSLLNNDPNKNNDNWRQPNGFKNDAQRHIMSQALKAITDPSFPAEKKLSYLQQLESLSDNNLQSRQVGSNAERGDLNKAIKDAISKESAPRFFMNNIQPSHRSPQSKKVRFSENTPAKHRASPRSVSSSNSTRPDLDSLMARELRQFETNTSHQQVGDTHDVPQPASTRPDLDSLMARELRQFETNTSHQQVGDTHDVPQPASTRPDLDSLMARELRQFETNTSHQQVGDTHDAPQPAPRNLQSPEKGIESYDASTDMTLNKSTDTGVMSAASENLTTTYVQNWFALYPDAAKLQNNTDEAATLIKGIFNNHPEAALKATVEQIGKGYRSPVKDGVPNYTQTDAQITFIRQQLSPEQLKVFDREVFKTLQNDEHLKAHFGRNHTHPASSEQRNVEPPPTFDAGWADTTTLGEMLAIMEKSAIGTPFHNFLRQVKDIKNLDAAAQKQLLQEGRDILAGIDKSQLSPAQQKLFSQTQQGVTTLEKSLPLAKKGLIGDTTTKAAWVAVVAGITALGVAIGALVQANRDVTVEGDAHAEDPSEAIADRENRIEQNNAQIAKLQDEIDNLSQLTDPSDAIADNQKALAEKQAEVDKLQAQVDHLRAEVGNKTEEQVRKEAVERSEAEAWQDPANLKHKIIVNEEGIETLKYELVDSAKAEAQAAGEQAVNEWKAQQAALAAAQTNLNGTQNGLGELQAQEQALQQQQSQYEHAKSEGIPNRTAAQARLREANHRYEQDIQQYQAARPAATSGVTSASDSTNNFALSLVALAGAGGILGGGALIGRRVTHMHRTNTVPQQVAASGEKLLGTIDDINTLTPGPGTKPSTAVPVS